MHLTSHCSNIIFVFWSQIFFRINSLMFNCLTNVMTLSGSRFTSKSILFSNKGTGHTINWIANSSLNIELDWVLYDDVKYTILLNYTIMTESVRSKIVDLLFESIRYLDIYTINRALIIRSLVFWIVYSQLNNRVFSAQ